MRNNRMMLKIIEKCPAELEEATKLKKLLDDDCLTLKGPVPLEVLANYNLLQIIRETGSYSRSSNLAGKLVENIHVCEAVCSASDDFV